MNAASRRVQEIYLVLLLLHTLAASFIWGINTLFLLDAGLSNSEAFAANAFFTAATGAPAPSSPSAALCRGSIDSGLGNPPVRWMQDLRSTGGNEYAVLYSFEIVPSENAPGPERHQRP